MPKGYWIANNVVHDLATYEDYKKANAAPFARWGAKFLVRAGQQLDAEGDVLPRTVVLEFPTYEAAVSCFNDPDYQAAMAIRQPVSDTRMVIVEGYDD